MSAQQDLAARVADAVRFSVPWTAALALVGPRDSLPGLPGAVRLEHSDDVHEWLAGLPPSKPAYAAVIGEAPGWRRVAREPGACDVFALREVVPPAERDGRDGLPLPPPNMVQLVAGILRAHRFYQRFVDGGGETAERIERMLATAGLSLGGTRDVLDFGCGCGRVTRHWKDVEGPRVHGTDYNPYLVDWCRANLPFGQFSVNGLEPGLDFPDAAFDLVYAYSVFTHLPESMQAAWLGELVRVTAPGSHLWLTFHGRHAAAELEDADRARFDAGDLAVVLPRGEGDYGTNACAVYHPEGYVRDTLAASLEVVGFVPGDENFIQDAYLLKKLA